MNEEEKKAIEKFKFCGGNFVLDKESSKVVLNLIEKLQKENSMLKKVNKITENITTEDVERAIKEAEKQYIPVQKVKDKIEKLKQEKKKYGNCLIEMYEDELVNRDIKILQELLEGRK